MGMATVVALMVVAVVVGGIFVALMAACAISGRDSDREGGA
jgi:hypothetical protein